VNPDGATVSVSSSDAGQPARTTVEFSSADSFRIVLRPGQLALPLEVTVDDPFPLAEVFVGELRTSPVEREFELTLGDRHGIAWADLNGDQTTDAYIVRGGVSGDIAEFGGVIQDELLIRSGPRFENHQPGSGIDKGACRGRIAAAIDVNRDGLLDLFSSCFQPTPKLYRALAGGGYADESAALAAPGAKGSDYAWHDLNTDGTPELLVAKGRRVRVIRRSAGQWEKLQSLSSSHLGRVRSMAVADYDRDGDPDVFAGRRRRNVLLRNVGGRLRDRSPRQFGLPSSGSPAVAWTDLRQRRAR